jgi:hypothetical protein
MESNFQKRVNQVSTGRDPSFDDVVKISVGNATHRGTGTIAIAVDGKITGANASLLGNGVLQGDTLVANGIQYQFTKVPTTNADGDTGGIVHPFPVVAINATADAYILRKVARPANNRSKVFAIWQPPIGRYQHDVSHGEPCSIQAVCREQNAI